MTITAWAPGRVNLIGEHTDYTGGLALPMAVHLGTTVRAEVTADRLRLRSDAVGGTVDLALPPADVGAVDPEWGRYVAAVASATRARVGIDGAVASDLPIGAGLSSSASLEVAIYLALDAARRVVEHDEPIDVRSMAPEIARVCRDAEEQASGVPCGIMDQLASAASIPGHALRLDCATLEVTPVAVPTSAQIVVVDSGQARRLAGSAYAQRRAECEAAERIVGPLRDAGLDAVQAIGDDTLRRRARHVVTENARVDAFADALARGDLSAAGAHLSASHASLRDDFEVSTSVLDELVVELERIDGVHGARLTGAGFGGCVIALSEPGVEVVPARRRGWVVTPGPGASVTWS